MFELVPKAIEGIKLSVTPASIPMIARIYEEGRPIKLHLEAYISRIETRTDPIGMDYEPAQSAEITVRVIGPAKIE